MKKKKEPSKWPLYLVLGVMFFSPFAIFLQGGNSGRSSEIEIDLELNTGLLSGSQRGSIDLQEGARIRDVLTDYLSAQYSNETADKIDCIGEYCGDWDLRLNDQSVQFLDQQLKDGDKITLSLIT